jgi:hypothetical protein
MSPFSAQLEAGFLVLAPLWELSVRESDVWPNQSMKLAESDISHLCTNEFINHDSIRYPLNLRRSMFVPGRPRDFPRQANGGDAKISRKANEVRECTNKVGEISLDSVHERNCFVCLDGLKGEHGWILKAKNSRKRSQLRTLGFQSHWTTKQKIWCTALAIPGYRKPSGQQLKRAQSNIPNHLRTQKTAFRSAVIAPKLSH